MARSFAQAREQSSGAARKKITLGSLPSAGNSYRQPAKRTAGSMYGAGTASYRQPAPQRRTYNPPAAPAYRPPPAPSYSPPAYQPAPVYNPPAQSFSQPFYGGGGGGGIGAFSAPAPAPQPAPAPPPPPPPPPPAKPERLKAVDWLSGDSAYQDQMSEYDRALNTFVSRIGREKKQFGLDHNLAMTGNTRNREFTLDQNADDFASRGMINSGLFVEEGDRLGDRFDEQVSLLEQILNRQNEDADNRLSDQRSEVQLGRGNAKRSALARMAAKQQLLDQGYQSKMDAYNARYF